MAHKKQKESECKAINFNKLVTALIQVKINKISAGDACFIADMSRLYTYGFLSIFNEISFFRFGPN